LALAFAGAFSIFGALPLNIKMLHNKTDMPFLAILEL